MAPVIQPKTTDGASISEIANAQSSLHDGRFAEAKLQEWFSNNLGWYRLTVRLYSGEDVPIESFVDARETKWAFTEVNDIVGPVIKINAASVVAKCITFKDGQIVQDNNKFFRIVSGLIFHEMGHVIFTPRNIDIAPEVGYFVQRLYFRFLRWIEKQPNSDEIWEWIRILGGTDPYVKDQTVYDIGQAISIRIAELIKPWVIEEVTRVEIGVREDIHEWIRARVKEVDLHVADYHIFNRIDGKPPNGSNLSNQEKNPLLFCSSMLSPLPFEQDWAEKHIKKPKPVPRNVTLDYLKNKMGPSFKQKAYDSIMAEAELRSPVYLYHVIRGGMELGSRWSSGTVLMWHKHANILEDQRLESQLSDIYGGFAGFFFDAIVDIMDPHGRYYLTCGRKYLTPVMRAEDKERELKSKASGQYPSAGFNEVIPEVCQRYTSLDAEKDTWYMAKLQAMAWTLSMIFLPISLEQKQGVDEEIKDEDLEGEDKTERRKKNETATEAAEKSKEEKDKDLTLRREGEQDPQAAKKIKILTLLNVLRQSTLTIAGYNKIIDDKPKPSKEEEY